MPTKTELVAQNTNLQAQLETAQVDHRRATRRANTATGAAVAAALLAIFEGGVLLDGAVKPVAIVSSQDGGIPSNQPSGSFDIGTPSPAASTAGIESQAPASQAPVESQAPISPDNLANNNEMGSDGVKIPVLSNIKQLQAFEPGNAPQGRWFNPIYDPFEADAAHEWRGIGPWYPVAVKNVDADAAKFLTHGTVGEMIVQANRGGRVEVAFWQIDAYQSDGAWGHDASGRIVHNPDWAMQYTFKNAPQGTEFHIVNADTGEALTWPDGTPVIYLPSKYGDFSFEVPKTNGKDVRVGIAFNMPAAISGEQPLEIKIERGPNDHPNLTGENPLPEGVINPMVPGAGK